MTYYNENDPNAAAWLRELISQGLIAFGIVDERSIEDVPPDFLATFTQCHFFAGIGVWSHALRLAGWPDDRPVWTGSCPCQPFSQAGKGKGFADERHLWPAWQWLIRQCRPGVIFGEQVAGKAGETWFDLVSADLEGERYSVGAAVTAACGFGAPHQRKRLYWVADTLGSKGRESGQGGQREVQDRGRRVSSSVALPDSERRNGVNTLPRQDGEEIFEAPRGDSVDELADSEKHQREKRSGNTVRSTKRIETKRDPERPISSSDDLRPGPTNGFWGAADWLFCRDGKWRAVGPGTSPLVNGVAGRVVVGRSGVRSISSLQEAEGRLISRNAALRGLGNAIVAQQAQAFIESYQG